MAMNENEQGFMSGGLAGAGTGAGIGAAIGAPLGGITALPAALIGAGIGFLAGGIMGNAQANSSRRAQKNAEKEAERLRRESIIKQMGAKQQADSVALAGLTSNKTGGGSNSGSQSPGGFIGANTTTTSGTF